MSPRRLITISFTGLDAPGGVPKFNRDLHAAFPDRECVHFCAADLPSNGHRRWEWEQARALNTHLIQSKKLRPDDVIIADGFWAWGLESFPYAVSHSHGIWSHLTREDVDAGKPPENPFHHAAQVEFRRRWTGLKKHITAVSDFIAFQMRVQWGFVVDYVIDNGVDTDVWRPLEKKLKKRTRWIIHGVNDRQNLNKGWDHIQVITDELALDEVMSLDECAESYGLDKPTALASADIVVHPSGYEGNSMFVAEALACGVPVIGYNVGYLYQFESPAFRSEGARVLDRRRRSPQLMLDECLDLLDSPEDLRRCGQWSRSIAPTKAAFDLNWRSYVERIEHGA